MSGRVERWWASGSTIRVATRRDESFDLFVRVVGEGPTVTLLHGYPSSSFDWRAVSTRLEAGWRVVTMDLLGFGRSDKPWPHSYAIVEQADLVEDVWRGLGIEATHLVVHDYSSSIGQELVGRSGASRLTSVTYLNGGIYPRLHRPTEAQQLLRGPGGDEFARAIDADLFASSIRATFGRRSRVPDDAVDDMWFTVAHDGGQQLAAGLLHYIDDRSVHGDRWIRSMERTPVPTAFVWGPEDPVSGAHVLDEVRRRMPAATVFELEGIGHWPMLEAPDAVGSAIAGLIGDRV